MSGSCRETLLEVWEAFPHVWEWLVGLPGCPRVVGRPSQKFGRHSRKFGRPARRSGNGRDTIPVVLE